MTNKAASRQRKETACKTLVMVCGLLIIALVIVIALFLVIKGSGTFIQYHHSIGEFLFSKDWAPSDTPGQGGGIVGAFVYIMGSVYTCALALLIAVPFSLAAAIFLAEISPKFGAKFLQPAIEIFVGIPSVVYGWVGMTVLVPFISHKLHAPMGGYSVLAAGIVLAVMIMPTITTLSADALRSLPDRCKMGALGMGATRWQSIYTIQVPMAKSDIITGVILGLSRALGETLAVAMVIGKTRVLPKGILYPTNNLTAAIAADMGNTANGSEYNLALWSMALLLLILSLLCIAVIHLTLKKKKAY